MNYFWLTLKHKWYVYLAGKKLKVPLWRLIKHDWTKLTPCEYFAYQNQFFGKKDNPTAFAIAWIHHMNHNDHHWEYWLDRSGDNMVGFYFEMPDVCVREMIADWFAACKAYDGFWPSQNNWPWMVKNFNKIKLNPFTRTKVIELLKEQGIDLGKML